MTEIARESADEIQRRLSSLPSWEVRDDALHREFRFGGFTDAFSFMTAVAFIAERMSHHPDWSNVYNTVTIRLSTHDVGGISANDFAMAAEISALYKRYAEHQTGADDL
ncbi:MAG: 4a-hydroxytetrahydrobiopterin dehydratase [Thermoanaerobaculia bacterium]